MESIPRMTRRAVSLLLLTAPAALTQDKKEGFRPGLASSYPNVQKQNGVLVAAAAYTTDAETKDAFGKLNPYEHGVLPVLFLIENSSAQTLRLEFIKAQYVDADRQKVDSIPAIEVRYLRAPQRPKMPGTSPLPIPRRKAKNPLDALEIVSRGFSARMLPPKDSANGFFYFQGEHRPGAILYVTGLQEAASGKELFYFEIPLDPTK